MKVIRICFFVVGLFFNSSCQIIGDEGLNISLIDVYEVYPVQDRTGNIVTPGQLQLTLEFRNNGNLNYALLFDNWLKEKKDLRSCFFTVACENGDEMNLSLGYVTHPEVLLPNNSTDTVVLEADFRELHHFYNTCHRSNRIVDFDKINFHYRNFRSENKIIISNKEFELVKTIDLELQINESTVKN